MNFQNILADELPSSMLEIDCKFTCTFGSFRFLAALAPSGNISETVSILHDPASIVSFKGDLYNVICRKLACHKLFCFRKCSVDAVDAYPWLAKKSELQYINGHIYNQYLYITWD